MKTLLYQQHLQMFWPIVIFLFTAYIKYICPSFSIGFLGLYISAPMILIIHLGGIVWRLHLRRVGKTLNDVPDYGMRASILLPDYYIWCEGSNLLRGLPKELRAIVLRHYMDAVASSPARFRWGTLPHESLRIFDPFRHTSCSLQNEVIAACYNSTTFFLWSETFKHFQDPRFRDTLPWFRHMRIAVPVKEPPNGDCYIEGPGPIRCPTCKDLEDGVKKYKSWMLDRESDLNLASNLQTLQIDFAYRWADIAECVGFIITSVGRFKRLKRMSIVVIVRDCDQFRKDCALVTKLDAKLRKFGYFDFEEGRNQQILDMPRECHETTMAWVRLN